MIDLQCNPGDRLHPGDVFQAMSPFLNKKIRFGLIGCGRIFKNHVQALAPLKEFAEISAVCDVDSQALSRGVESTKAQGFGSYEELLKAQICDVISLCTPSGIHAEQAIQAARQGVHAIVEKPMATRLADGLAMTEAFRQSGSEIFVVKQNRLNPTIQLLKKAIEHGRFGKLVMVNVNVFWTRPQSYYDSASWRGTRDLDGGALMNQASHYVDLLQWLFGPVERVSAFTQTLARKIEVEDTAAVTLQWKDGALGSLNVTMLAFQKNLEGSITVLGEKGTARVGGVALNEIQLWQFEEVHPMDAEVHARTYPVENVYGSGHSYFYRDVVEALRSGRSPDPDRFEGLKSLMLLDAIYVSAQEGRPVRL